MKRVLIESPFGHNPDGTRCNTEQRRQHVEYLHAAIEDSLLRGEAPFASHAIYPLTNLDDDNPEHRRMGMEAGFAWGNVAQLIAVYADFGITPGMLEGIVRWREAGFEIEERRILP